MDTNPFVAQADLVLRPAAERFHSQHGWLDSWHSFSFADHVDPAWMGFGPLRVRASACIPIARWRSSR